MPPSHQSKKFRAGRSGAYTAEYHDLLGKTPWIVVRRLLHSPADISTHLRHPDAAKQGLDADTQVAHPHLADLSEGDIATVFSQFGEVLNVVFVRHRRSGRFLGTCFVRFADYRSGICAADDMNSNLEENDNVYLTRQEKGLPRGRGIEVERCDVSEVSVPESAVSETYSQWEERTSQMAAH